MVTVLQSSSVEIEEASKSMLGDRGSHEAGGRSLHQSFQVTRPFQVELSVIAIFVRRGAVGWRI
jgi:hypothetical protein